MVKDVREALERAQGDPPPWRIGVDDFVAAGRRLERRRRVAFAAGTSAAAVLAAGGLLAAPSVLDGLDGSPDGKAPAVALNSGAATPTRTTVAPRNGDEAAVAAFTGAGYDHDDAVLLSRLWGRTTPEDAKARAGQLLLSGQALPTRPGDTPATAGIDAALEAYFGHGYDYEDASRLADVWKQARSGGDLGAVKVRAGRELMAGHTLPIQP